MALTDLPLDQMIYHVNDVPAYEAPGEGKRTIRYIVEKDRAAIERFFMGLTTLEPGQRSTLVTHPEEEVFFMLEGTATMRLGDEEQLVGVETVIVIPSNTPHQIIGSSTERVRFLFVTSPRKEIEAKHSWRRVD